MRKRVKLLEIGLRSVRARTRIKTLTLLLITLMGVSGIVASYSALNTKGSVNGSYQSSTSTTTDYSIFVSPYLSNIETLRAYLMLPPNPNQSPKAKIGLNPTYGLIQGDYVCGGYQALGSSLNNNDLMAGKGLDYLNSLKGINSTIEANTRMYLGMQFNNTQPPGWACTSIMPQSTWTYSCTDKHELLFGEASPCYATIISSCATSGGNEAFITKFNGIQMLVESGVGGSCLYSGGALNDLAPYINYLWLKGDSASILLARQIFNATLSNWTSTAGTGYGGTTGGCFSTPYGPNPTGGAVARTRDLGFWLNMVRATGLWNSSSLALTVSQEVVNQIWAQQKSDGSIAVDYPQSSPAPCGGTSSTYPKDSGESDGLTIAAFDPRVPAWFTRGPLSLSTAFSFSPSKPGVNQQVTFTSITVGGSAPYAYTWNFGDGVTAVGAIVTHPYVTAKSYTVSLEVKDSAQASATYSKSITVYTAPPPNFSISASPISFTLTAGNSATSTVTVKSLNGFVGTILLSPTASPGLTSSLSKTSLALSSGASQATIVTISTDSSLASGNYGLNLTGSSGTISNSITLTFALNASTGVLANNLPTLSLPLSAAVSVGSTVQFVVVASDSDRSNISLTATNLPPGASFNPTTGTFSWTPGTTQAGSYHVNFTAIDDGNPPMSQTKTVTIQVSQASNGGCALCSVVPKLPTLLWLLLMGAMIGIVTTLAVLALKTRGHLNQAKQARAEFSSAAKSSRKE